MNNNVTPAFLFRVKANRTGDRVINQVRLILKDTDFNLSLKGRNPNRVQFVPAGPDFAERRRYTVGDSLRKNQSTSFSLYLRSKNNSSPFLTTDDHLRNVRRKVRRAVTQNVFI